MSTPLTFRAFIAGAAGWWLAALLVTGTPCVAGTPSGASELWGSNGGIGGFTTYGNTLYVIGGFTAIGPSCGGGVPLDANLGAPLRPYPKVAGEVYAVVGDGSGGWFIGGAFSDVGGEGHINLAHILANGRMANWAPSTNARVNALAFANGVLYVGGEFTEANGQPRALLVALDATSGAVRDWDPAISGPGARYSAVNTILLDQTTAYIGGDFSTIGGQARRNLARVDLVSASATPFDPEPDGRVLALALADSTLYVGGEHYMIGDEIHACLAAVNAVTGEVRDWDAGISAPDYDYDPNPYIAGLATSDGKLYVIGHFTRTNGVVRGGVAAFDMATGILTGWNPHPVNENTIVAAPTFFSIAISGTTAYIGGYFKTLGGQPRTNLGAVSLTTGLATEWDPRPLANEAVHVLAHQASVVYAGGYLSTMWDWQSRSGLAAFNLDTGELLPWAPVLRGYANDIAVDSAAVYLGGGFWEVNGDARANLAAVDRVSAATMPLAAAVDGSIRTLALQNGTLFLGGWFRAVNDTQRLYLAAVDAASGTLTPWNPSPGYEVDTVVPAGSSVYVSGSFEDIGYAYRQGLAEVDAVTGRATDWNPGTDGSISSMLVDRDVVYVAGWFSHLGGAARTSLGAVDRKTGAATAWDPAMFPTAPSEKVQLESLLMVNGTLYIGGQFGGAGGAAHWAVAAVDTSRGAVLDWNPRLYGGWVNGLAEYQGKILLGGSFTQTAGVPASGLAAVDAVPRTHLTGGRLALSQCSPNPVSGTTLIDFVLPVAAKTSVSIFDLQGRRVASVLNAEWRSGGHQQVRLSTQGLPTGCYLYRVDAAGLSQTRKMLVVN